MTPPRGSAPPPLTYADETEARFKMLGSLPVIASFCRRLGIAAIIDDEVPIRDLAAVTAGQAVEAMVCNRLTSPAPLAHVEDWARTWAVPETLGITPASLNDDKLGRTLDAIAPHLEQVTSAVAVRAITAFDIDISRLHCDMTCCRCRPGSRRPATAASRSTTAPTTAAQLRYPRSAGQ